MYCLRAECKNPDCDKQILIGDQGYDRGAGAYT
jgi:hypothetical protein